MKSVYSALMAAVLLLACAGTAAGAATWVVDADNEAGVDYGSMQMGGMTRLLPVAAVALVAVGYVRGAGG